jgi:RNA polymerase sporulation-specific sigma factor
MLTAGDATGFVGYISNNVFPDPLTEEEESAYLKGLSEGNEEARTTLIERNLRLVAHIVKKFEGTGEDPDDLISIGTIGLIKAVNTYDPAKGTKLATYAAKCIENEILMYLRAAKKSANEVSLFDPIGVDKEGNEVTLLDILGTDPDAVAETVEKGYEYQRIQRHLARLDAREREVLEMRYGILGGLRRTQREIARRLGISRSYVSRIEKKAIQKLIKELEKSSSGWQAT